MATVGHYIDYCVVCGKEVPDYEPVYCCNGRDCGCNGLPVEPCLCSKECEDKVIGTVGSQFQEAE